MSAVPNMVRTRIRDAETLQRKSNVPTDLQTPDRSDAADWIECHVVNGTRDWTEWTITEIADETGWSRTHISNTLEAYFDAASDDDPILTALGMDSRDLEQSGTDYRAGLRDGFREGVRFALENEKLLEASDATQG